jgi:hypothetical protein
VVTKRVHAGIAELPATYRTRAAAAATIPTVPDVAGSRVLMVAGVLAAPFLIAGYVGLTMLLILPLVGLRAMFPRSAPLAGPWSDNGGWNRP